MSLQISSEKMQYTDQSYVIDGGIEELNSLQNSVSNTLGKSENEPGEIFMKDTVDISEAGQGMLQKLIEPGTENFKSGYYEELCKVSEGFSKAFKSLLTNAGTGIDYKNIDYNSIDYMMNKYNEIYKRIEDNYSGSEKDDKLKELSDAYAFTFHKNIIKPIEQQIDQAKSDAEAYESMYGFLQNLNEYHKSLVSGSSPGVTALYDVSEVRENVKQYKNMIAMLHSLEDNVVNHKDMKASSVAESLHNIISSMIEKLGTDDQKKEYASINLMA